MVVVFSIGIVDKKNAWKCCDGDFAKSPAPRLTSNSDLASFHVEDVGSTGIACKNRRMLPRQVSFFSSGDQKVLLVILPVEKSKSSTDAMLVNFVLVNYVTGSQNVPVSAYVPSTTLNLLAGNNRREVSPGYK